MADSVKIEFEIGAGELKGFLKQLKGDFKDLNVHVNQVEDDGKKAFTGLKHQICQISFVSITQGIENLRNTLREVTGPGIEFNQTVADLSAITGIAGKDLEDLSKTARKTGKESGLGASQAAEAFKLLASQISVDKIGIDGLKILQKETIALAQASGMDMPTAANSMASAINQFGLEAEEASRVINVLAAGAKYGAAEVPDLARTFKEAGAGAKAAGMDIEELAGAAETLSKNATVGAQAGTQLRNIILLMQNKMGIDFGTTSMSEALDALKPRLKDSQYLTKIFGQENVTSAQFLIDNADMVQELTDKVRGTNVAYEQAAIRNQTIQHELDKTTAWFDDLKIGITEATGAMIPHLETTFQVAQGASTLVPLIYGLRQAFMWLRASKIKDTIATVINTGVTKALAIGTKVLAVATRGLGIAFRFALGPVGLVITGLGLVAAGVTYAWNQFEGFRKAIFGIWEAVKKVFSNIAKFIGDMLSPFFEAVQFIMAGEWGKAAKALGKGVMNMALGQFKFIGAVIGGDITEGVGAAFDDGQKKGAASFAASKEKREKEKEQESLVGGLENLLKDDKATNTAPGKDYAAAGPFGDQTTKTTASGNQSTKTVEGAGRSMSTHIENLVNEMNIYVTSMNDMKGQIRRQVEEALTGAVRDFEVATS